MICCVLQGCVIFRRGVRRGLPLFLLLHASSRVLRATDLLLLVRPRTFEGVLGGACCMLADDASSPAAGGGRAKNASLVAAGRACRRPPRPALSSFRWRWRRRMPWRASTTPTGAAWTPARSRRAPPVAPSMAGNDNNYYNKPMTNNASPAITAQRALALLASSCRSLRAPLLHAGLSGAAARLRARKPPPLTPSLPAATARACLVPRAGA